VFGRAGGYRSFCVVNLAVSLALARAFYLTRLLWRLLLTA
jgi:hypothetical protein